MTRVLCTIGTTDPWNAAGIGLDLRLFSGPEVHLVSIVTAVSAQDRGGIQALHVVPASVIEAQFESLRHLEIGAYRLGALASREAIDAVAAGLAGKNGPMVLDPVLASSGGGAFLDERGIAHLRDRLLPRVSLITPNLDEAALLAGRSRREAPADLAGMIAAARALRALGAAAVLVKGGHLAGDPIDLLDDGQGEPLLLRGGRITGGMRGTGCFLAAAVALELAQGRRLREAVASARALTAATIREAETLGGMRVARGRSVP